MNDKKMIVEIKDINETITELDFLLQEAREVLKELNEKKEVLKGLGNLKKFEEQVEEIKKSAIDIEKVEQEMQFYLEYSSKIAEGLKEQAEKVTKFNTTLTTIVEEQAGKIDSIIINNYTKMLSRLKQKLISDFDEINKKLKFYKNELQEIYERDYLKDVRSLKKQQKTTNFLLFVLIILISYFSFYFNKKLNVIEQTTIVNYSILNRITH